MAVAGVLAFALLVLWLRERRVRRAQAARRRTEVDRELGAVSQLSEGLAGAADGQETARRLVDAVFEPVSADFAAVALVDEAARRARGLIARGRPEIEDWWPSMRVRLDGEPSGIATAARERRPIVVDDVESSPLVSARLAEQVKAKTAVFVPVTAERAIRAVLVVASEQQRAFTAEELALLQALAAEAALALARVRTATALEEALAREQLVARIGRRVRSELDLDAVLRTAAEELGRAIGVSRAFVRLGGFGEARAVAEWEAPGVEPVGSAAARLPALNLAVRDRRTVRVSDIEAAAELHDAALGDIDLLRALGVRAVLATPIVVFDDVIGVFGMHRAAVAEWADEEVALAEAVAREAGLAIHTARLLDDDRRRGGQQGRPPRGGAGRDRRGQGGGRPRTPPRAP